MKAIRLLIFSVCAIRFDTRKKERISQDLSLTRHTSRAAAIVKNLAWRKYKHQFHNSFTTEKQTFPRTGRESKLFRIPNNGIYRLSLRASNYHSLGRVTRELSY